MALKSGDRRESMLSGNFSTTAWHDIPGLGKAATLKTAALHLHLLGWAFGCGCDLGYLVQIYTAFAKGRIVTRCGKRDSVLRGIWDVRQEAAWTQWAAGRGWMSPA
jgi:hypothetical protein